MYNLIDERGGFVKLKKDAMIVFVRCYVAVLKSDVLKMLLLRAFFIILNFDAINEADVLILLRKRGRSSSALTAFWFLCVVVCRYNKAHSHE